MQIVPLTLQDRLPWAQLLALSFDRTLDEMLVLLDWLCHTRDIVAWGAWDGERLAAQYACLMTDIILPEGVVSAGMSFNMAVHPDYRGQGLVKKVSQPVYEMVQACGGIAGMGFSNAEGVKVDQRSKGYGYQVVGQMMPSVVALSPRRHVPPLELTDTLPEIKSLPIQSHPISFAMSACLIEQRYHQHPFRRYQYAVWPGQGVVIYRHTRLMHLPAVTLLGAYGDNLPELMARWASAMRQNGIYLAHVLTTPASQLKSALMQTAIVIRQPYTRSPYYLTVKPLNQAAEVMLDFARWDCAGGDIL